MWVAAALAALALLLVALAAAIPFMQEPPAGRIGSIATLVIAAEILAALAILVVGKELYTKLWERLQALRAELSEHSSQEKHDE